MPLELTRGSITEPDDLDIQVVDSGNSPIDPHTISYALYDVTTGVEVLIGPSDRLPVRIELGHYYAHFQIPENAAYGLYRIRWTLQETTTSPQYTVMQEFEVVQESKIQAQLWTPVQADLIRRLRTLLRDNNPDKHYHFRPPTSSGTVNEYNRVFAYIWEDNELIEYMEQAMFAINASPPETHFRDLTQLVNTKRDWIPWVMTGATVHACIALALNWIADEFDYSIGGISLSIEKSSKYESIKQNAEGRFDKMMENKSRTVKIMRGLRQSRYGLGVRSSFGPVTGKGVMTPRKFMGL
jgi:hypothetical protein